MKIPFRFYPHLSLNKLGRINFFPTVPLDMERRKSICIGTKSGALGDALLLTPLPRKLKKKYPGLKVYTFSRGFNPVVFERNPYVDGVQYLPPELYGDDINDGSGHLISTKERFFGLEISEPPKPEIYLSAPETAWAKQVLEPNVLNHEASQRLPLVFIHPWGGTCQKVLTKEIWAQMVAEYGSRVNFLQIGVEGHERIPGCKQYYFFPKSLWSARKLFALLSQGDGLIGVDSGPMHVARALDKPSLIFSDYCDIERLFSNLRNYPYYLHQNYLRGCLYEDNTNVFVGQGSDEENVLMQMRKFLRSGLQVELPVSFKHQSAPFENAELSLPR